MKLLLPLLLLVVLPTALLILLAACFIQTREMHLLQNVWGMDYYGTQRSLDRFVASLRKNRVGSASSAAYSNLARDRVQICITGLMEQIRGWNGNEE
jgi:hypothetical protein